MLRFPHAARISDAFLLQLTTYIAPLAAAVYPGDAAAASLDAHHSFIVGPLRRRALSEPPSCPQTR